jgi:hypothetical protein
LSCFDSSLLQAVNKDIESVILFDYFTLAIATINGSYANLVLLYPSLNITRMQNKAVQNIVILGICELKKKNKMINLNI